jgi:hypothetical protein
MLVRLDAQSMPGPTLVIATVRSETEAEALISMANERMSHSARQFDLPSSNSALALAASRQRDRSKRVSARAGHQRSFRLKSAPEVG